MLNLESLDMVSWVKLIRKPSKKLDYATLIAVCDINKDQLKEVNEGVKTFLKADQLLAEKDIDTVIIAVPNHPHLEMVKKAAAAKKDIILENQRR